MHANAFRSDANVYRRLNNTKIKQYCGKGRRSGVGEYEP